MANRTESERESIITSICNKVIEDKISFNEAVKDSEISLVTFYMWISKSDDLQILYNYAREIRSDVLFEQIIEIADKTEEGKVVETDDHGRTKEKVGDMTQHRKLKIDSRKWVVSRMNPKKYGDKLDLTTKDKEINKSNINLSKLSEQELRAYAELQSKLETD